MATPATRRRSSPRPRTPPSPMSPSSRRVATARRSSSRTIRRPRRSPISRARRSASPRARARTICSSRRSRARRSPGPTSSPSISRPPTPPRAFSRGAIDAWSIWDPFYAIAELKQKARPLPIDPKATVQNSFFLANRDFLAKHADVVAADQRRDRQGDRVGAANIATRRRRCSRKRAASTSRRRSASVDRAEFALRRR